ncbi:MAG: SoxR reducing system RseC family protein [Calditrichia bacterium]
METEIGRVKAVQGNDAVISLQSNSRCGACSAKFSCALGEAMSREITIPNTLHCSVGNKVEISYKSSSKILSTFVIFLLPIVLLLAGYFLGSYEFDTQNMGILGSVAGLIAGAILLWVLNRFLPRTNTFKPQMIRKIAASS